MKDKTHNQTERQAYLEDFDYSSFEKEAIGKLMAGQDLIGTDGVLKEIIQRIVHAALDGEINHHLSTERKVQKEGDAEITDNRRNGTTRKQLKTSMGAVEIRPPRDRAGTFEPLLVKKWDRNLNSGLDNQILELYAKGNSVSDIRDYVKRMYGPDLSAGQITAITDNIWEDVLSWKKRVLKAFYVLVYLDAIYFRIRENGKVVTKAIYTVYGIDANGERDILDLHIGIAEAEGAKEWGRLLEKIKDRGVEDVLFFSIDGLSGFSEVDFRKLFGQFFQIQQSSDV